MNQPNTNRRIHWERASVDEIRYRTNGTCIVRVAPRYFCPTEVEPLQGFPSKAQAKLGWTHTTQFPEMVREDLKAAERDVLTKHQGLKTTDCHE